MSKGERRRSKAITPSTFLIFALWYTGRTTLIRDDKRHDAGIQKRNHIRKDHPRQRPEGGHRQYAAHAFGGHTVLYRRRSAPRAAPDGGREPFCRAHGLQGHPKAAKPGPDFRRDR